LTATTVMEEGIMTNRGNVKLTIFYHVSFTILEAQVIWTNLLIFLKQTKNSLPTNKTANWSNRLVQGR